MPRSLEIDKHSLDEELIQQPQYFMEVGEALAEAMSIRDEATENARTVAARLDQEIRDEAFANGEKLTEARVLARINLHADHVKANEILNEAKKEAEVLRIHKEAWSQRGYALRDLVQLYIAGYFTVSSVKAAGHEHEKREHEELRESSKEARQRVAEALEKRRQRSQGNE